jgi:TolB-like protein/class 3 adenylate cyclase
MGVSLETAERKLTAILAADVVGYSRLMAADEEGTRRRLRACREVIDGIIRTRHGRVFGAAGDSVIAEFPSAVEAVRCALEIQQALRGLDADLPEEDRMRFRIGVNLGDVMVEGDDLLGDGVNVASRLEALAEPGGIRISAAVQAQVEGRLEAGYEDLGEHRLKNIPKPVRVYSVTAGRPGVTRRRPRLSKRAIALMAALVPVLVVVVVLSGRKHDDSVHEAPVEDAVLAIPRGPSIAVLPFTNMSGDPSQEYFGDGLTEDIITELSRFRELFVIARNSTFQYKGKAVDVRDVGRDLDVRYVLEGSVRKAGTRIRVTAQLLDSSSGTHLWGETYDRDLTASQMFDVQDDITDRVVAMIGGQYGVISRAGLDQRERKRTENLDAYDCLLRSYVYLLVHNAEEHLAARTCLERAVELDPDYVDAQAWLAYTYAEESRHGWNKRPELYDSLERALEVAERAVELDPTNQVAHGVLAVVHFDRHEIERFYVQADLTLALNPNNAFWIAILGSYMAENGDFDRGIPMVMKAMALNPHHPSWLHIALCLHHYHKGEYEEALAQAQKVNLPGLYRVYFFRAAALGQLGRKEEAQREIARMLELSPDLSDDPRIHFGRYNYPDEIVDHLLEGLRKAGLGG